MTSKIILVSRYIIKPSSLISLIDQIAINAYLPFVAFYPSSNVNAYETSHDKTLLLNKSLSQTLASYYPFASRLVKTNPSYVDCSDEGVEFIEAYCNVPLLDFLQTSKHEDLDQLFPDDLEYFKSKDKLEYLENNSIFPLTVQVNHFSCGGVAVPVSLFHKIEDGNSLINFMNHWGMVTRSLSEEHRMAPQINPYFISYETRNTVSLPDISGGDCVVAKIFVFSNSKINSLKEKVKTMTMDSGELLVNPTRAEALTWLLHNCVVDAATKQTRII